MSGEHRRQHGTPGIGERDDDTALVLGRRSSRDQARPFEQPHLVRQPAAAVDDPVRQVRHPQAAVRRVPQGRQQLELHVAQVAGVAELLLDGVPEQAADLDQGEVGAEFIGAERACGRRSAASHQCRCFDFEAAFPGPVSPSGQAPASGRGEWWQDERWPLPWWHRSGVIERDRDPLRGTRQRGHRGPRARRPDGHHGARARGPRRRLRRHRDQPAVRAAHRVHHRRRDREADPRGRLRRHLDDVLEHHHHRVDQVRAGAHARRQQRRGRGDGARRTGPAPVRPASRRRDDLPGDRHHRRLAVLRRLRDHPGGVGAVRGRGLCRPRPRPSAT